MFESLDNRRAQLMVGGGLTAVGLGMWLMAAIVSQPAIDKIFRMWRDGPHGLVFGDMMRGIGWDTRWAAIVVAAGGLRLLAGGGIRGRVLWLGLLGWFAVDGLLLVLQEYSDGPGLTLSSAREGALVLGVFVAVSAITLAARHSTAVPLSPQRSLVYSAASVGVGVLLFATARPDMVASNGWPWATMAGLAVLLVVAGVVTALTVGPHRRHQWRVAAGTTLLGVADVILVAVGRQPFLPWKGQLAIAAGGIAIVVLGCAWLTGTLSDAHPRRATMIAVVLMVISAPAIVGLAHVFVSTLVPDDPFGGPYHTLYSSDYGHGAFPLTIFGAVSGAGVALFAIAALTLSASRQPSPNQIDALPPPDPATIATGVIEM